MTQPTSRVANKTAAGSLQAQAQADRFDAYRKYLRVAIIRFVVQYTGKFQGDIGCSRLHPVDLKH